MNSSDSNTPRRQHVLVFRELPADQLARLQALHTVTVANPRLPAQREAFLQALPTADALVGSSYAITDELLDQAPRLRVVSSISVGVDNYPVASLARRGILLCHTPGVLTETTADTLFGLIMATSRRIPELAQWVREGHWTRNIAEDLFGWDVHGKTLGILGMGRIGQALAQRAALGFNMRVLYSNRSPVDDAQLGALRGHVHFTDRDALLSAADFVVLALPLTPQTRGLIGQRELGLMKPGAILVNGSRGAIVDEAALLQALEHGSLRAAGLDVFATEPLPHDSPLRTHPRVVALPHIGSATHETRQAMAELATTNAIEALAGRRPPAAYAAASA